MMNEGGYIEREDFEGGFVMVPNSTAQDENLTPAALGVLVFIESLPPDWIVRDHHIRKHFGLGRDALRTVYAALEKAGYAQRLHRVRQGDGTLRTITKIRRKPIFLNKSTDGGFSAIGSPAIGKPTTIKRNKYKYFK